MAKTIEEIGKNGCSEEWMNFAAKNEENNWKGTGWEWKSILRDFFPIKA